MSTSTDICAHKPNKSATIPTSADINMKHIIHSTQELGMIIRAVRKSTQVRQDDLAAVAGVSRQFAIDVEKGKPTVQMNLVLNLLHELGIELSVNIPQAASEELARFIQEKNSKPEQINPQRSHARVTKSS